MTVWVPNMLKSFYKFREKRAALIVAVAQALIKASVKWVGLVWQTWAVIELLGLSYRVEII